MTTLIREANAAMITGLSIISSGSDQRGMVFAAMAATGEVQDGFMLSGNTRSFRRTVPSTLTKAQTLCLQNTAILNNLLITSSQPPFSRLYSEILSQLRHPSNSFCQNLFKTVAQGWHSLWSSAADGTHSGRMASK